MILLERVVEGEPRVGEGGTAVAQWLGAVLQIGRMLVRSQLVSVDFSLTKSFRCGSTVVKVLCYKSEGR